LRFIDEDPSASNPSASDDENAHAEPGASTGSDSMPAPPPKRGMIFKNAFGASDVEEDGDEEDDGDDEPGSRSVSKGKKKMPSNGVGINPADGQPGGFELVDKDGDSMRRKIRIEYITDKSRRHITFSKRKAGIMKKVKARSSFTYYQSRLLIFDDCIGVRAVHAYWYSGVTTGRQRDRTGIHLYDGEVAAIGDKV